jgi:hypothetical protein
LGVVLLLSPFALLVFPVGGDSQLRVLVHLRGPDLDLHPLPVRADHRGVEGLVLVGLGKRDVILEATRDRRPDRMHQPQSRVDHLPLSLQNDPEGDHVVDLIETEALGFHLVVDRSEVLEATGDLDEEAGADQLLGENPLDLFDVSLALLVAALELALQLRRDGQMQGAKGQILELALHPVDPEPVGQGYVDVEGLLGDAVGLVFAHVFQRAHVVEPIDELDQEDANVLGHRDQHLPEALGLALPGGGEFDSRDLGQPLHEEADLLTEEAIDLVETGEGVLHGVVEQSRDDGHVIEAHVHEDPRHFERMDQIGLPGVPHLAVVDLRGVDVCALEQGEIAVRIVLEDAVGDVVEAQHPAWIPYGNRYLGPE